MLELFHTKNTLRNYPEGSFWKLHVQFHSIYQNITTKPPQPMRITYSCRCVEGMKVPQNMTQDVKRIVDTITYASYLSEQVCRCFESLHNQHCPLLIWQDRMYRSRFLEGLWGMTTHNIISSFFISPSHAREAGRRPTSLGNLPNVDRAGVRSLEFSIFNEEYLVITSYQIGPSCKANDWQYLSWWCGRLRADITLFIFSIYHNHHCMMLAFLFQFLTNPLGRWIHDDSHVMVSKVRTSHHHHRGLTAAFFIMELVWKKQFNLRAPLQQSW